ncbi:hypothetical protein CKAN_02261700 [Cinnamomum micranthum f. kanehirae]|uniref:Uncharacterized protein n=1 Tax=Cinnamomum micranthum f. kanehirae TaxID=337451 RepID=A0A3S4PQ08_9MAGN|nr:hypothetical protein CKAN_02261700 [Cinnamomum micranthum f. kanehirae]
MFIPKTRRTSMSYIRHEASLEPNRQPRQLYDSLTLEIVKREEASLGLSSLSFKPEDASSSSWFLLRCGEE